MADGGWQMVYDKQSVVDDRRLTLEVVLPRFPMAFDSLSAAPLPYFSTRRYSVVHCGQESRLKSSLVFINALVIYMNYRFFSEIITIKH